jgi:hypothetical protein
MKLAPLYFYNLLWFSYLNGVGAYIYMRFTSGGSHYEFNTLCIASGKAEAFRHTIRNSKKNWKNEYFQAKFKF